MKGLRMQLVFESLSGRTTTGMPDYALMNQCLYEGKAKEVEQMTQGCPG